MGMIINPYSYKSVIAGPLIADLKGHWDLSEASGTRYDSTSTANHMVFSGTIGTDIASVPGVGVGQTAASFAGGNYQYLITNTSQLDYAIGTSPFLINYWDRLDSIPADWAFPTISTSPMIWSAGGGWMITTHSYGGNYRTGGNLVWRRSDNSGHEAPSLGGSVSAFNIWKMHTIFFNPATNTAYGWRNAGEFQWSIAMTGSTSFAFHLFIGYLIQGSMQSLSIWKGANATTIAGTVGNRPILNWLYNSGTSARLYSDIAAYGT